MTDIDSIVRKYAAKAEQIYESRTAGDYTWLGVLGSMLQEIPNPTVTLVIDNDGDKWTQDENGTWSFLNEDYEASGLLDSWQEVIRIHGGHAYSEVSF